MAFVTGVARTVANLERAEIALIAGLDEGLKAEAEGTVDTAKKLLQTEGSGSGSRAVADEAFVVRGQPGSDEPGILGARSSVASQGRFGAKVVWSAGFDHAAAHKMHQRGRTKEYLRRALRAQSSGMGNRIGNAVNRALRRQFGEAA